MKQKVNHQPTHDICDEGDVSVCVHDDDVSDSRHHAQSTQATKAATPIHVVHHFTQLW